MATSTADPSVAARWTIPVGMLAVSTATIGAIFLVTPPAASTSDSETRCHAEVTATGPILRMCGQGRVR